MMENLLGKKERENCIGSGYRVQSRCTSVCGWKIGIDNVFYPWRILEEMKLSCVIFKQTTNQVDTKLLKYKNFKIEDTSKYTNYNWSVCVLYYLKHDLAFSYSQKNYSIIFSGATHHF